MTPIPLKTAFEEMRDRLLAITELAMPEAVHVKPFIDVQLPIMPYAEIVVPGGSFALPSGGQTELLLNVEVRVWCGDALEGNDGELQNTIYFDWMPTISETFVKYGRLAYPDNPTFPPWLNPAKTGLQRAQVVLDQQWLIVFFWQVALKTAFICM